ncbi:MAG: head GIN domain-containing protein, partial [Sphingosinicella sp.]
RTQIVRIDHSAEGIEVRFAGREPVRGSGVRVRQARAAVDFTHVIADDCLDVEIRIGPSTAIELEGDDNLIDSIRTDVERGTLHLRVRQGYHVRRAMVARIVVPRIERVELEASGDARISGLDGGRLRLASHGSGSFTAAGRVDQLEVEIEGSGNADLENLQAREARIQIDGTGDAEAHVTDTIVARVNGTGEIVYRGEPRSVTEDIYGTGNIRRRKD